MSRIAPVLSDVRLKLAAALLAFAAGVGAVVTVALLAHSTLGLAGGSTAGPQAGPPAATTPAPATGFPRQPAGALVLAQEDRDLAVGLAVSPRGRRLALQASVIGQDGPSAGFAVSFRLSGARPVAAVPCGAGCYGGVVARGPAVVVAIRGPSRPASAVTFRLPASIPGPSGAELVHRADRTWRRLRSLVIHDRLSSGPGNTITTLWQIEAPSRLAYRIRNGPEAVVIGARRWDRLPGHGWQASRQDPISQPVPPWEGVSAAHVIGTARVKGRAATEVSFFDQLIPAWFTIWVDRQTARTLELRMTTQEHFMHQVYGPFNAPVRIVPPTGSTS